MKVSIPLLVFLLLLFSVSAQQPVLPTLVYGQLIDPSGFAQEGVSVTVQWTHTDGTTRTITTSTLTSDQATARGDPNLVGHYVFGEGSLVAQAGSPVEIIVDEVVIATASAAPGEQVLMSPRIYSSGQGTQEGNGGTSQTTSDFSDSPGSPSSVPYDGPPVPFDGTSDSSSESGEGAAQHIDSAKGSVEGDYDGEGTDGDGSLGNLDKPIEKGTPSEQPFVLTDTIAQTLSNLGPLLSPNSPNTASGDAGFQSSIVGSTVNGEGEPVGGVEVSVQWESPNGEKGSFSTQSLTKEEAEEKGDSSLEGSYSIDKQNIPQGSNVTIKTLEEEFVLFTVDHSLVQFVDDLVVEEEEIQEEVSGYYVFSRVEVWPEFIKRNIFSFILLAGIILSVFYFRKRKKKAKAPVASAVEPLAEFSDNQFFTKTKARQIMQGKFAKLQGDTTVEKVITEFFDHGFDVGLILEGGNVKGVVSRQDLLFAGYEAEKGVQVPVKDVMTHTIISVDAAAPLKEVIGVLLEKKIDHVLVLKKRKPVGIISSEQLLYLFSQFFKQHEIAAGFIPSVGTVKEAAPPRVKTTDVLLEIYREMKASHSECALVQQSVMVNGTEKFRPVGVVHMEDLYEELYKNPDSPTLIKAKHVMNSPILSSKPGQEIVKLNEIMREKNVRRIPLLSQNSFVGVVSQVNLLHALFLLSQNMHGVEEEKKESTE